MEIAQGSGWGKAMIWKTSLMDTFQETAPHGRKDLLTRLITTLEDTLRDTPGLLRGGPRMVDLTRMAKRTAAYLRTLRADPSASLSETKRALRAAAALCLDLAERADLQGDKAAVQAWEKLEYYLHTFTAPELASSHGMGAEARVRWRAPTPTNIQNALDLCLDGLAWLRVEQGNAVARDKAPELFALLDHALATPVRLLRPGTASREVRVALNQRVLPAVEAAADRLKDMGVVNVAAYFDSLLLHCEKYRMATPSGLPHKTEAEDGVLDLTNIITKSSLWASLFGRNDREDRAA